MSVKQIDEDEAEQIPERFVQKGRMHELDLRVRHAVDVHRAHRHPPQQILTISASGSSGGCAPTAASAGDWRAVLHVQAVVVGTVDYRLRIYGMERGEQDAEIPSL